MPELAKEYARRVRNRLSRCVITDEHLIVRRLSGDTPSTIEIWVDDQPLATITSQHVSTLIWPLTRSVKRYIDRPERVRVSVDGSPLNPRIYWFHRLPSEERLPRDHLARMLEHGWSLNADGQWSPPGDGRLKAQVHVEPPTRSFLEFDAALLETAPESEYGTIELYIDHVKISDVLLTLHPDGTATFPFRLSKPVAAEIVRKHVLSCRRGEDWFIVDTASIERALAEQWDRIPQRDLLGQLASEVVLNHQGALIGSRTANHQWISSTFDLYSHARAEFSRLWDYELFPVGGTLLGIARDSGVIAFDKDFDTGYASRHQDPAQVRQEWKTIILTLLRNGENIHITNPKLGLIRCDFLHWRSPDGSAHIDVFPGAFTPSGYRRPTFVDTDLTAEDFFPLVEMHLGEDSVWVPRNYEKKLEAVYGPSWRAPDPFWKKVRTPEIKEFRRQIMLQPEDLLEIAEVSPTEGDYLREVVPGGHYKISTF